MELYLVRHAHAGPRHSGGRDRYRPLTDEGQERAQALVQLFADTPIDRLISSPATRCLQTLAGLAFDRDLEIDEHPDLWEGSNTVSTLQSLEALADQHVVACSHGDIIPAVVDQLVSRGVPISGRGCELGSLWILDLDRDRSWTSARYVSPRAPALP